MAAPEGTDAGFGEYLVVLRRRKIILILSAVLVTSSALVLSLRQTPVYEAHARLIIQPTQSLYQSVFGNFVDESQLQAEVEVMQSEPVADEVRRRLGSAPGVSATVIGNTAIIDVAARSTEAVQAAETANAYGEAYIDYRRRQGIDDVAADTKVLQEKLDDLDNQIAAADARAAANASGPGARPATPEQQSLQGQRAALKEKFDQVQIDTATRSGGAFLVRPAAAPSEPVIPQTERNVALGLLLGTILGVGLAFAADQFDESIKDRDELERLQGDLPLLAVIPRVTGWKSRVQARTVALTEPTSSAAEAYRTLRTSIRFFSVDRPMRTIQVTSPAAGEGKTTTAANLAVAMARAGQQVTIISCDLRRPRVHDFFGLSNEVGFTSVLLGAAPLSAALQQVPNEPRLQVLASGPLPPNPSELLASNRAAEVIAALAAAADTVLVDCPPVLPVTDAAILSARVDGTIVVVTPRSTTRKQLRRTLELLRQVKAPVVGTVLNGGAPEGSYGYEYGYYATQEARPSTNGEVQEAVVEPRPAPNRKRLRRARKAAKARKAEAVNTEKSGAAEGARIRTPTD